MATYVPPDGKSDREDVAIEWLESVGRIRSRLIIAEGLLASLILDTQFESSERLGKALRAMDSIFDAVDHLNVSMKMHLNADPTAEGGPRLEEHGI